jgi:hypothetical protein
VATKIVLEIASREMNWKRIATPEMRYANKRYLFDDSLDGV